MGLSRVWTFVGEIAEFPQGNRMQGGGGEAIRTKNCVGEPASQPSSGANP